MKYHVLLLFILLYHPHYGTTYYVDAGKADNTGSGLSWTTAKKDLQEAINAASAGDTIWVKQGTYYPTQGFYGNNSPTDPRQKSFHNYKSLYIYGGFNGTETILSARNILQNITTLSGDIGTRGVHTDNSYQVVHIRDTNYTFLPFVLDGFTIKHGRADSVFKSYIGGGIYRNGFNFTIRNCIIDSNLAGHGGGIFSTNTINFGLTSTFSNNIISNNTSLYDGSGLNCTGDSLCLIRDNYFFNNQASGSGGAIYLEGTFDTIEVSNNVIYKNYAGNEGGGLILLTRGAIIVNNTIVENRANSITGGLFSGDQSALIQNNIFWNNKNNTSIYSAQSDINNHLISTYTFVFNNLLQNNNDTLNYPNVVAAYSGNIYGLNPLFQNINSPLGADGIFGTADDGLRIRNNSIAINAGSNTVSNPTDVTGKLRIGLYDIGAYEGDTCTGVPTYDSADFTICAGDSIYIQGKYQKTAGIYKDTLINSTGCDSIRTIHLIFKPRVYDTLIRKICTGDSFLFDGVYRVQTGIYSDTSLSQYGCDSISTLMLTVSSVIRDTLYRSICHGDSIFFKGLYRRIPAIYHDTLKTAKGCDSISTLVLSHKIARETATYRICIGDSFFYKGKYYKTAQTFIDTTYTAGYCMKIITKAYTIATTPIYRHIYDAICQGGHVLFYGQTLTKEGAYTKPLNGCDTAVVLHLKVHPKYRDTISVCKYQGDGVNFNGIYRTATGVYTHTTTSQYGCDSVSILRLTINPKRNLSITSQSPMLLATKGFLGYRWYRAGTLISMSDTAYLFASGVYTVRVTDSNGCSMTSDYSYKSSIEQSTVSTISIYPNPAHDIVYIKAEQEVHVELYNMLGQKIISKSIAKEGEILLHDMAEGIYYCRIYDSKHDLIQSSKLEIRKE